MFLTLVMLAAYYTAAHWLGGWTLVGILFAADILGGGWPLALLASVGYLAFIGNWMGVVLVVGFALVSLTIVGIYAECEREDLFKS